MLSNIKALGSLQGSQKGSPGGEITIGRITEIEEFLKHIYFSFKLWRMVLISVLGMSIVPGTVLFFMPQTARLVFAYIFAFFCSLMLTSMVRFIGGSIVTQISISLYNRKHTPKEQFRSEVKQIAKKMGVDYDKPVYVTDNSRVKGPFVNPFTGKITLPSSWEKKFHRTENLSGLGHELGHIKGMKSYATEVFLVFVATFVFTLVLGFFTIPLILIMAEFAFMMLLTSYIMWRNEYRADYLGANATTPEALISVFQQLRSESKRDDGAITHPPLDARIKRLMPLLDKKDEDNRAASE